MRQSGDAGDDEGQEDKNVREGFGSVGPVDALCEKKAYARAAGNDQLHVLGDTASEGRVEHVGDFTGGVKNRIV